MTTYAVTRNEPSDSLSLSVKGKAICWYSLSLSSVHPIGGCLTINFSLFAIGLQLDRSRVVFRNLVFELWQQGEVLESVGSSA